MIDKTIDNYRITKVLGKGGMGIVYKAIDMDLEAPVAIKMIDPVFSRDQTFLRRFKKEAQGLAKAKHPNIVTVHRFLDHDDGVFIVMEYIDGQRLDEYFDEHWPVSWHNASQIFKEILKALGHAHKVGVFHRDIKPSNIMITRDGLVKVMDFGLAKVRKHGSESTITQVKQGTLKYMSPEVITLSQNINYVTSDIYSLGMTFYEMLTGRTPFEKTDTDWGIQEAIVRKKFQAPNKLEPGVPKRLAKIVMRAIEKKPEMRFQSIAEMLDSIKKAENYSQAKSRPVENKQRSRWLYLGIFLTLLVMILAVGAFYDQDIRFFLTPKASWGILTEPVDAKIFVNDEFVGRSPIKDYQIKAGIIGLKIHKEAYFPIDTTLTVDNSLSSIHSFKLKPVSYVSIRVTPEDATVFLDGKKIETARNDLMLSTGSHVIFVSKAGYISKEERFDLIPGMNPEIYSALNKESTDILNWIESGELEVDSTPDRASVWLNDKFVGHTPFRIDTKSGDYEVRVTLDGYSDFSKNTTVRKDRRTKIDAKLFALGGIQFSSHPSGATVWISGKRRGITPVTIRKLHVGRHNIVFKKAGHKNFNSSVKVMYNETISVSATLVALKGRLQVLVKPFGSIFIDNELHKKDTDIKYTTEISSGRHLIRVVHPDFGRVEKEIYISPGRLHEEIFDFNKEFRLTVLAVDKHNNTVHCKIYIDGKFNGHYAPAEIMLRSGQYLVEARHNKYNTVTDKVVLDQDLKHKFILLQK